MNMREFLSWAQRHYRIDVSISTVECKSGGMASTGTCPGRCEVPGLRARSAVPLAKKNVKRLRQDTATYSHRHTSHRGSNAHTPQTYCVECGTCTDSVPGEIFDALETTRSASSNCNQELADRAMKDTTIQKQQIDLATRMMLDQISRLSDGDYEQSTAIQLFLDCIARATASSTAFVSFREQPMHFKDNQTVN